jgi:hypothetical protein
LGDVGGPTGNGPLVRWCPGGGPGSAAPRRWTGFVRVRKEPWLASPGCVIVLVGPAGIKGAFGVPCGDNAA